MGNQERCLVQAGSKGYAWVLVSVYLNIHSVGICCFLLERESILRTTNAESNRKKWCNSARCIQAFVFFLVGK